MCGVTCSRETSRFVRYGPLAEIRQGQAGYLSRLGAEGFKQLFQQGVEAELFSGLLEVAASSMPAPEAYEVCAWAWSADCVVPDLVGFEWDRPVRYERDDGFQLRQLCGECCD